MRYKELKDLPIKKPKNISQQQWEKAVNLYRTAKSKGDKFPELTVAQAALETGWFKSPSGKYNYFGQKASESQRGSIKTTKEFEDNQELTKKEKFRDYDSLSSALEDRMKKWGSKYQDASNVREALYSIWSYDENKGRGSGYATDIKYDEKIFGILGMLGVNASKDKQIYSTDEKGQVVNVNPEEATEEELQNSSYIKQQFYQDPEVIIADEPEEEIFESKEAKEAEKNLKKTEATFKIRDFFKEAQAQQEQQTKQYQQPNLDSAYNYIDIETYQNGGEIPTSRKGLHDYPKQKVIVPTTNGNITMKGINYPVFGIADTGEEILMQPGKNYHFKGAKEVLEIPKFQDGGTINMASNLLSKTIPVVKEAKNKLSGGLRKAKRNITPIVNEVNEIVDENINEPISESIRDLKKETFSVKPEYLNLTPTAKTNSNSLYQIQAQKVEEKDKQDYKQYFTYKDKSESPESCDDKECASFLTNRAVEEFPSIFNDVNYRGSGWTMHQQIVDKGGVDLGHINSMYPETRVEKYDEKKIKEDFETIAQRDDWKKHVKDNIEEGQIVSLYYPKSSHFKEAYEESKGKQMNTHVGEVVRIKDSLYVRDNVSGKVHLRPIERVLENKEKDGVMIVGLAGINPSTSISTQGYNVDKEAPSSFKKNINSDKSLRALKSLRQNKEDFKKSYGLTDEQFETLEKATMAILYQESMFGDEDSTSYNMQSGRSSSIVGGIVDMIRGDEESISMGNVKIPLHYTEDELRQKGFDTFLNGDINNMESPEFSSVLTADVLLKNAEKLKKIIPDISDEDLVDFMILAHNQGTEKFEQAAKVDGYDYSKFKDADYLNSVKKWMNSLKKQKK